MTRNLDLLSALEGFAESEQRQNLVSTAFGKKRDQEVNVAIAT
jgi:hypothetical protein